MQENREEVKYENGVETEREKIIRETKEKLSKLKKLDKIDKDILNYQTKIKKLKEDKIQLEKECSL